MASGKMFSRVSVVLMTSAVIGACGGDDEDAAVVSAADTMAMAPMPAPITDTTAIGTIPGAPVTTPGAAPVVTPPAQTPPGAAPAATPAAKAAPPPPAAAAGGAGNVAEGQRLYASGAPCVACHGPNGTGTALAPALNDNQWLWFTSRPSLDQLSTLIKAGVPTPKQHPAPMPAMGGAALTDAQIRSISAYVLSISG